jgi:hypothetical protein
MAKTVEAPSGRSCGEGLRRSPLGLVDAVNTFRCIRRSRGAVSRRFASSHSAFPQVGRLFAAGSIPGSSTKTAGHRTQKVQKRYPTRIQRFRTTGTAGARRAIVSARTAKLPLRRRIPALSGRTWGNRTTALSVCRRRRLPPMIAPIIHPQKKPRRKNLRTRRLFLRATAHAMYPHVAAMMATIRTRNIRCIGPSEPIAQPRGRPLRRPLNRSNHRPCPARIADEVRDQSEHEVLASWCELGAERRARPGLPAPQQHRGGATVGCSNTDRGECYVVDLACIRLATHLQTGLV